MPGGFETYLISMWYWVALCSSTISVPDVYRGGHAPKPFIIFLVLEENAKNGIFATFPVNYLVPDSIFRHCSRHSSPHERAVGEGILIFYVDVVMVNAILWQHIMEGDHSRLNSSLSFKEREC